MTSVGVGICFRVATGNSSFSVDCVKLAFALEILILGKHGTNGINECCDILDCNNRFAAQVRIGVSFTRSANI